MADLGLPRSLWACYEAWQNNSDRWWQMSLRARLRVGAHANETNETLCVSFSPCACTPKACANRNTHRHIKAFTGMTPANQNKEKFFLKRWRLNPSLFSDGFRHHWHTFPFFQKKQNKKKNTTSNHQNFGLVISALKLIKKANSTAGNAPLACANWIQF